ncbi:hypothetical protein [uncultured Chitinophaga sp.]|jgi:hypothetical protein|uniref:hypothetical protein n=1 Tax=uncultured Chitinophaga sp. TaxID=339340 RepID=UPI002612C7C0|nr:hypothetical protein [uncultured Chitinophaga sp.]
MPIRSYLLACCALLLITVTACKKKKGSGGDTPPPQEVQLTSSLDGVQEGNYTAALGPTHSFTANITSELPASGVSVTVSVVTDPGGQNIPQDPIPSPVNSKNITINLKDLPPIRTVKVIVTISSLSNPNNQIIKEFWITNKADQ